MLSLEQEHIFERCKEANSGFRVEAYAFKRNPGGVWGVNLRKWLTLYTKPVWV